MVFCVAERLFDLRSQSIDFGNLEPGVLESSVGHDDWSTAGGQERMALAQEVLLDGSIADLLARMDLGAPFGSADAGERKAVADQ